MQTTASARNTLQGPTTRRRRARAGARTGTEARRRSNVLAFGESLSAVRYLRIWLPGGRTQPRRSMRLRHDGTRPGPTVFLIPSGASASLLVDRFSTLTFQQTPLPTPHRHKNRHREMGRRYAPAGFCIYCGARGPSVALGQEHIVPKGLGGTLILPDASCRDCEKITGAIEQQCLRRMFWRSARLEEDSRTKTQEPAQAASHAA
jgi:hypothetical protein